MRPQYPFSAVVGLEDLRLALLVNAVSPVIGGVLVRGEKGTAKSTVVRALSALLPALQVSDGCRFSCDPAEPYTACPDGPHETGSHNRQAKLVELPVGATEDRLVGALNLERVLSSGQATYEPGLLAGAHRGVLYVDEVNLLHDHLVDLLLDAAAMGEAYVERDGVSVRHAARFLLVGTMNPEEGELRPQLLDRFGLTVEVRAPRDAQQRAEVVRRRLAYEDDPHAFAAQWKAADADLATRIAEAQSRLSTVELPDAELLRIAHVCASFEVDGMRADIVVARTAKALAAWRDRTVVTADDVRDAARLALPHRRRRNPFDAPDLDEQALEDALNQDEPSDGHDDDDPPPSPQGGGGDRTEQPDAPERAKLFAVPGTGAGTAGRRSTAYTKNGRVVGAQAPQGNLTSLHLAATLRKAAPHQRERGRVARPAEQASGATDSDKLILRREDLREPIRQGRESNVVLFCVDASGSMAARQRMGAVKGAVLSLLLDAYQRRDKVGLVTFRGDSAELALPPTSSVEAGAARLRELPTGGRTPIASGLMKAAETLRVERLRDPQRRALLIVVTDGRATSGADPMQAATLLQDVASIVVDCESGVVRLGLARKLAEALGAEHVPLSEVSVQGLTRIARKRAA